MIIVDIPLNASPEEIQQILNSKGIHQSLEQSKELLENFKKFEELSDIKRLKAGGKLLSRKLFITKYGKINFGGDKRPLIVGDKRPLFGGDKKPLERFFVLLAFWILFAFLILSPYSPLWMLYELIFSSH